MSEGIDDTDDDWLNTADNHCLECDHPIPDHQERCFECARDSAGDPDVESESESRDGYQDHNGGHYDLIDGSHLKTIAVGLIPLAFIAAVIGTFVYLMSSHPVAISVGVIALGVVFLAYNLGSMIALFWWES